MLVTWVSHLNIGQRLWRKFLRVTLLITNSRIHAGCIICLSLCIGWCLHRILDEKEQWQLILAEYSIIHVSSFLVLDHCFYLHEMNINTQYELPLHTGDIFILETVIALFEITGGARGMTKGFLFSFHFFIWS